MSSFSIDILWKLSDGVIFYVTSILALFVPSTLLWQDMGKQMEQMPADFFIGTLFGLLGIVYGVLALVKIHAKDFSYFRISYKWFSLLVLSMCAVYVARFWSPHDIPPFTGFYVPLDKYDKVLFSILVGCIAALAVALSQLDRYAGFFIYFLAALCMLLFLEVCHKNWRLHNPDGRKFEGSVKHTSDTTKAICTRVEEQFTAIQAAAAEKYTVTNEDLQLEGVDRHLAYRCVEISDSIPHVAGEQPAGARISREMKIEYKTNAPAMWTGKLRGSASEATEAPPPPEAEVRVGPPEEDAPLPEEDAPLPEDEMPLLAD